VLHRRGLDQLEAEMMAFSRAWDRAVDGSPNRLDAAVWGLTRLSKVITHIPIASAPRSRMRSRQAFLLCKT
jgi:phage terminase large subunit-like protein